MMLIDNTMISAWKTCPVRKYLRHDCDLVPVDYESAPLDFGKLVHACISEMHKNGLAAAFRMAEANWTNGCGDKNGRTLKAVYAILSEYDVIYMLDNVVETEIELRVKLPGVDDVEYVSRIDKILLDKDKDSRYLIVDTKTSTRAPNDVQMNAWSVAPQFVGYVVSARLSNLATKYDISDTFCVDSIVIRKDNIELMRHYYVFQDWLQEEWLRSTTNIINMMRNKESLHGNTLYWNCDAYHRTCDYFPICSTPPQGRSNIIDKLYTKEPWLEQDGV